MSEIIKEEKPIDKFKSVIDAPSVQTQFQNAMGQHKEAFIASLIDLYTGDASLQKCAPKAIVAEALRAATLRLPLNKALGFSYIVVFNNSVKDANGTWQKIPTPTFLLGYKGYIQLAMRTGQYRTINADVVYDGEVRKVSKLTGEIALDGEKKSEKIVGYFCYFELMNGFNKTLYMSIEEMAKYAIQYSPSFRGGKKPTVESLIKSAQDNEPTSKVGWEGNFTDMALKTVMRRLLSKYGYLSVEMHNAIESDVNSAEASRNDIISDNANKQKINLSEDDYEEVKDDAQQSDSLKLEPEY